MKNFWFITDENDENTRLDNYLSELYENFSRSHFQKLIKNGKVLVNDAITKPSYKIKLKDKIEIENEKEKETIILPQDIPIEIIWEDENMAIIKKPSGILTHPTEQESENTLVNALLYKFGENLSDINGYFRRGIVHRLDRNTSGLLMIAKNNKTHEFLAEEIKKRRIEKKYLAIVKGIIKEDSGTLDFPIGRNPNQPQKMAVVEEKNGGKPSLTEYKVLKRYKDATYLELDLKTGRTHQIRVHLSHIGHPIINDTMYGAGQFKVKTQDQVLQSYKLKFAKPFSSGKIDNELSFEIEPDEKIKKVLKYLENLK